MINYKFNGNFKNYIIIGVKQEKQDRLLTLLVFLMLGPTN